MLILTDLDDTLFQTKRKCPPGSTDLAVMSTLADGSASGFATPGQQRFLAWLRAGEVVPVTARSREVLGRVLIDRAPAICSNGGCVVTGGGQVDREWHSRLTALAAGDTSVQGVSDGLETSLDPVWFRYWVVEEGDLPLYIVVKSNEDDGVLLKEAEVQAREAVPGHWRTHRNGNNLAFLPPWLNKRHAAAYLIDKTRLIQPDLLVVGVGDSHSDVGFMDLCDFAMTPTSSQLWKHAIKENDWCL